MTLLRRFWVIGALLGGCLGEIDGGRTPLDPPPGPNDEPVTVGFVAPAAGAAFAREVVVDTGELGAAVAVEVAITGAPTRVELRRGDLAIGAVDAAGRATVTLIDPGDVT